MVKVLVEGIFEIEKIVVEGVSEICAQVPKVKKRVFKIGEIVVKGVI